MASFFKRHFTKDTSSSTDPSLNPTLGNDANLASNATGLNHSTASSDFGTNLGGSGVGSNLTGGSNINQDLSGSNFGTGTTTGFDRNYAASSNASGSSLGNSDLDRSSGYGSSSSSSLGRTANTTTTTGTTGTTGAFANLANALPSQQGVTQSDQTAVVNHAMVQPVVQGPVVRPVADQPTQTPTIEKPIVNAPIVQKIIQPVLQQPVVQPIVQPPIVEQAIVMPAVQPQLQHQTGTVQAPVLDPSQRGVSLAGTSGTGLQGQSSTFGTSSSTTRV